MNWYDTTFWIIFSALAGAVAVALARAIVCIWKGKDL
jgi:hypothetical protein